MARWAWIGRFDGKHAAKSGRMSHNPKLRTRRRRCAPVVVLAASSAALSACSSATSTPPTSTTSTTPATSTSTSTTSPTATTRTDAPNTKSIEAAWLASINAFYLAGEQSEPSSSALLQSLVPGSPELKQETSFLEIQKVNGIVGPSTWRIGNVAVLSSSATQAVLSACSFDPGAYYRATGEPAPTSLGGGAGYTGYVVTLDRYNGKWLVFSTQVSAPTTTQETGPCHGF
jgi:hypothetical protein